MRAFIRMKQSGRLGTALLLALSLVPLLAMKPGLAQEGPAMSLSVPDDWTHHHLVFSGARSDAAAERLQYEPRYLRQWLIHNRPRRVGDRALEPRDRSQPSQAEDRSLTPNAAEQFAMPGVTSMYEVALARAARRRPRPQQAGVINRLKQDWAVALPATAEVGDNMYPAKFTFDVTAAPDCANDFVAFNTGAAAISVAASQTGTFTASSLTGTVTVNGIPLTASPGTAASQSTTISANNVNSGNTITITNGASSATYTASPPTSMTATMTIGLFRPADSSTVTIGNIVYTFRNVSSLPAPALNNCSIRSKGFPGADSTTQVATNLFNAITNGGSGGTGTWLCASGATPNSWVSATRSGTTVNLTAATPGSTGFTFLRSGTTNFSTFSSVAGTDGSTSSGNFQWWYQNAAADATRLAGNIRTAIGGAAAVGVGAGGSGTTVTLTATASGLAGNSITVATTIPSGGLAGAAFNGPLSGGTAGTTSGTTFKTSTDSATASVNLAAEAAALASAINTNVTAVTATSAAGVVTVTAAVPGTAGNSIGTTETFASGFTWGGATLTGGVDGAASIVAYNKLYSTQSATLQGFCGGSGPSVMWSYTTGTGAVLTSPVLSLDGTKIVYVETKASGAVLHVLKWVAGEGTGGTPAAPANVVTNWSSCTSGSCLVNVALSGTTPAVTRSAPFYDYANDVAFVGDDNGVLHKFTSVLSGTPAEVTTGGWPVTVHAGYVQNGPVLDSSTNRVFVTDSNGTTSYVCYVPVAGGSAVCAASISGVVSDPVLVDSSQGRLYAVSSESGASVHQYDASFAASATPLATTVIALDSTNSGRRFYSGAFDHAYLTSADGSGKMYVCGKSGSAGRAQLYRLTVTPTMSGSWDDYMQLTTNPTDGDGDGCSPVTEFYNASTGMDWIFLSVGRNAGALTGTTCSGAAIGCVMSFNVTGTEWPQTVVAAGYVTPGNTIYPSTSGIIVDNSAGTTTVPKTTLGADITAAATSLTVGSVAGFALNDYIEIDAERLRITANPSGTTLAVSRGQLGTAAENHLNGTAVTDLRVTTMTVASGNDGVIDVYSTTTFNVGDYIQIDNEAMKVNGKATTTLTVARAQLGSSNVNHTTLTSQVLNLSAYPQAASVYFSFATNSGTGALCNGSSGVGCAVKLTQDGMR